MKQTPERAIAQFRESGYWPWVLKFHTEKTGIRGTIANPPSFLVTIGANPKFLSGSGWILHKDVGNDLIDFRSIKGVFGKGSLQIVFDKKTGAFWSDVDRFNPYQGLYYQVCHVFLECIPDLIKAYKNENSNTQRI